MEGSDEADPLVNGAQSGPLDRSAGPDTPASGHEAGPRSLSETRTALARVEAERDRLLKELRAVESTHTETVALPEDTFESAGEPLPTIEELMASLGTIEEKSRTETYTRAEAGPDDSAEPAYEEMIPPELIITEDDEAPADESVAESSPRSVPASAPARRVSKVLVYVDDGSPIKYPLYKEVITIGRSDAADIQIEGDFISRMHARIVTGETGASIEDLGSTNGIRVNSERVTRHDLVHGDIVTVGKLSFAFVDTAAQS